MEDNDESRRHILVLKEIFGADDAPESHELTPERKRELSDKAHTALQSLKPEEEKYLRNRFKLMRPEDETRLQGIGLIGELRAQTRRMQSQPPPPKQSRRRG